MDQHTIEQFDSLEDRVMALEFALHALVAGQSPEDHLRFLRRMRTLSDLMRSADHPHDAHQDMTPVAAQLDSLRVFLSPPQ